MGTEYTAPPSLRSKASFFTSLRQRSLSKERGDSIASVSSRSLNLDQAPKAVLQLKSSRFSIGQAQEALSKYHGDLDKAANGLLADSQAQAQPNQAPAQPNQTPAQPGQAQAQPSLPSLTPPPFVALKHRSRSTPANRPPLCKTSSLVQAKPPPAPAAGASFLSPFAGGLGVTSFLEEDTPPQDFPEKCERVDEDKASCLLPPSASMGGGLFGSTRISSMSQESLESISAIASRSLNLDSDSKATFPAKPSRFSIAQAQGALRKFHGEFDNAANGHAAQNQAPTQPAPLLPSPPPSQALPSSASSFGSEGLPSPFSNCSFIPGLGATFQRQSAEGLRLAGVADWNSMPLDSREKCEKDAALLTSESLTSTGGLFTSTRMSSLPKEHLDTITDMASRAKNLDQPATQPAKAPEVPKLRSFSSVQGRDVSHMQRGVEKAANWLLAQTQAPTQPALPLPVPTPFVALSIRSRSSPALPAGRNSTHQFCTMEERPILFPATGKERAAISFKSLLLAYKKPMESPFVTLSLRGADGQLLEQTQDTPAGEFDEHKHLLVLNCTVPLTTPLTSIPSGSTLFLEVKHYKPKEKRVSMAAWSFVPTSLFLDFVEQTPRLKVGLQELPLYSKPLDPKMRKLKRFNPKDIDSGISIELAR